MAGPFANSTMRPDAPPAGSGAVARLRGSPDRSHRQLRSLPLSNSNP